ncbi:DUF7344 domain-containing protein [Halosimplex pelagicum]|uniref:DUF7344 domain-containing protein n=1 Tax=Halosimplex pelagicum TaxID=869886 RepID=UPI001FE30993|nr:hypothetical protein [Halosimplex pelagicum]
MTRSDGADGGTEGRTPATDGGERGDSGDVRLPASAVADLRASGRRRRALERLAERGDAMPVTDLARRVVASERGEPAETVPDDAVEAARSDLFQRHLPKLTATGVVRYDSLVGTVELATDDPRLLGDDGEASGRVDDVVAPE